MRFGIAAIGLVGVGIWVAANSATISVSPANLKSVFQPNAVASALPLPRFVSLKSDRVNARQGPTPSHAVQWVFAKQGLPLEMIAEKDNWAQVRDSEGAEAWVNRALISGRRTALVARTPTNRPVLLRAAAEESAKIVAKLGPGVLATLNKCTGNWCYVLLDQAKGWVRQQSLWGVYPGEKFN